MKVYANTGGLIGSAPFICANAGNSGIYAKPERANPAGRIKDRAVKSMPDDTHADCRRGKIFRLQTFHQTNPNSTEAPPYAAITAVQDGATEKRERKKMKARLTVLTALIAAAAIITVSCKPAVNNESSAFEESEASDTEVSEEYTEYTGEVTTYTDSQRAKCLFTVTPLYGDDGVIQRETDITVWGTADKSLEGRRVYVSYDGSTVFGTVTNGSWKAVLPAHGMLREGTQLTVTCDAQSLVFENVRCGDVYLASGQSNMCYYVEYLSGSSRDNINADCDYPDLGFLIVPDQTSTVALDTFESRAGWVIPSSKTIAGYHISSTAFLFARELYKAVDIPIGVVVSAYGGSPIEYWIDSAHVAEYGLHGYTYPADNCWNSMISPLRGFSFKGVIWYQGEGNAYDPGHYAEYNSALVRMFRDIFGNEELPFIQVGLPSFSETDFSEIRLAQLEIESIGNAWTTVNYDTGNPDDLHPTDKLPVCIRLADMAKEKIYGIDSACTYPAVKSYSFDGSTVTVVFDSDVTLPDEAVTSLSACDADGNPLTVTVTSSASDTLVFECSGVACELRCAMDARCLPNVITGTEDGLPIRPFVITAE